MNKLVGLLLILTFATSCKVSKDLSNNPIPNKQISYDLPYFGKLTKEENTTSYAKSKVSIMEDQVRMDINIPKEAHFESSIQRTKEILSQLEPLIIQSQDAINKPHDKDETIQDFVLLHLEYLEKDDCDFLGIDFLLSAEEKESALYKSIQLRRVGLYPDDSDYTIIFDYAISKNGLAISTELLVFSYTLDLTLRRISMES